MTPKNKLSPRDSSIVVNIRSLSHLLANEETHDPLWLGMAFGYAYAIITQSDPQGHDPQVADVVLDLFKTATIDIDESYHLDPIEELHKLM